MIPLFVPLFLPLLLLLLPQAYWAWLQVIVGASIFSGVEGESNVLNMGIINAPRSGASGAGGDPRLTLSLAITLTLFMSKTTLTLTLA